MLAQLQWWILLAFYGAIFVVSCWALVDVLRRPKAAFTYAGKRTKGLWLALMIAAVAVSFVATPFLGYSLGGGLFSFLAMAAAVGAGVYLVDVRPAVAQYRPRGRSNGTPGRW